MSALTMILTAAMAVPGDGPAKAPAEMVQTLDMSGEWEGTWKDSLGYLWKAKLRNGQLECKGEDTIARGALKSCDVKKEGIYKWEGNRLFICFAIGQNKRPKSFRGGKGQELFILHRVKSCK